MNARERVLRDAVEMAERSAIRRAQGKSEPQGLAEALRAALAAADAIPDAPVETKCVVAGNMETCVGCFVSEALANAIGYDEEAIADLASHAHGMGQQECASHHPEMIAAAKEEGRREAIALIAAENRAQAARAGCQGRCNQHGNACRVARSHEGRCVCGWCP